MFWTGLLFSFICTAFNTGGHTPDVWQLRVPDHPQVAYRKALSTAIPMGTAITQANQSSGIFQGTLRNAVVMTVETIPSGQGALVQVTATLRPNKVAFGSLTEAEDFIQTLQNREYWP